MKTEIKCGFGGLGWRVWEWPFYWGGVHPKNFWYAEIGPFLICRTRKR